MFKSVEYVGFESKLELRQSVERVLSLLTEEIGSDWHDSIVVVWRTTAASSPPTVELSLTLQTPIGSGSGTTSIARNLFQPSEEQELRSRFRRVWIAVLDRFLEQRKKVWDEYLREPLEV